MMTSTCDISPFHWFASFSLSPCFFTATPCTSQGVEDINMASGEELNLPHVYVVFINGLLIGLTQHWEYIVSYFALLFAVDHVNFFYKLATLRKLRRSGRLSEFVSAYPNHAQRSINIASDGGRVCRPYIIVANGKSLLTHEHIRQLKEVFAFSYYV
jgi:DNA-directed RNA polymerase III subunit RPC2